MQRHEVHMCLPQQIILRDRTSPPLFYPKQMDQSLLLLGIETPMLKDAFPTSMTQYQSDASDWQSNKRCCANV
jgi:hypothetical protein